MPQRSSPQRQKAPQTLEITAKIEMVGRKQEIERLLSYLRARKTRHFVYYWAHGGLGKTRLLEELLDKVRAEGPGYHSSGLIDLYHTDTHSNSDVERLIVEGVDPEARWFPNYRWERREYLRLRELGANSTLLEERRAQLSDLFVAEFNLMAQEAHKLVLIFDTVELLQYESSLVEEQAGLDTVDTRLKPWLLRVLPNLLNVLVVFAGRPKQPAPGEQIDPQARLEADFRRVFGDELDIIEMPPLTREETDEFVGKLPEGEDVLGKECLAVAHTLTSGRPIFIHLLVDLLRSLAEDQRQIRGLLDECQKLVGVKEDDPALQAARAEFNQLLLDSIFNNAHEFGGYLGEIGLMPKGVDREILVEGSGLPPYEADELLDQLRPLSFVKQYQRPTGREQPSSASAVPAQPHLQRIFLHDEMYSQLTSEVMQNLRLRERQVAKALVSAYYTPRIVKLEAEIQQPMTPEERMPLRESLHKLQVERLYYYLVQDPRTGYREYRELSDRANRERHVGFSMRLLDEFLRFYNRSERRKQFEAAGIPHERVIRENALLWLERFHWWARYDRAIEFADRIMTAPDTFFIEPGDAAIMGIVVALWARDNALLHGYKEEVVERAEAELSVVREAAARGENVGLAQARLATSIGYLRDLGGDMEEGDTYYEEAIATFKELGCCEDELAMVLNNEAWRCAMRGEMILARPFAHEGLALNETSHQRYSTGLTLATLANIENIDGNWREAEQYAQEAWEIFDELQDPHGRVLALLARAQAKRKRAKYEIQKGRKRDDARQSLEEARKDLEAAVAEATEANLCGDLPVALSKLAKVYRELGRVVTDLENPKAGSALYLKSKDAFERALGCEELVPLERAGMLVDYAEMLFVWANLPEAEKVLVQFRQEWTSLHGQPELDEGIGLDAVTTQFRRPLGKYYRLLGQMTLAAGREEEALHLFARAFAAFQLFSPTCKDGDRMVELLHDELRGLPVERRRELADVLLKIAGDQATAEPIERFKKPLTRLLGGARTGRS